MVEATPYAVDPVLAALLGALQGLTEFLPVSSSGHLSLAQAWLGIDRSTAGHTFNIAVHAGTLVAVLWTYRHDLVNLMRAALRPTRDSPERRLLVALIIGTLPLIVVLIPGVEAAVVAMEARVRLIGVALLVTGAVLVLPRWLERSASEPDEPRPHQAIVVGLAQLLAVLPGISRSGATIVAGIGAGIERARAARFSFLLSIPAISAASLKESLSIWGPSAQPATVDLTALAIGFVVSLVVGLLALHWLLRLVERGRLGMFAPYLLVVGVAAIAWGGS